METSRTRESPRYCICCYTSGNGRLIGRAVHSSEQSWCAFWLVGSDTVSNFRRNSGSQQIYKAIPGGSSRNPLHLFYCPVAYCTICSWIGSSLLKTCNFSKALLKPSSPEITNLTLFLSFTTLNCPPATASSLAISSSKPPPS